MPLAECVRDNQNKRIVVLDNGTGRMKVGFSREAGTCHPDHIFPSIVGKKVLKSNVKSSDINVLETIKDIEVGKRVERPEIRQNLACTMPVKNGQVHDIENMKHIWDHCFSEEILNIPTNEDRDECKVIITHPGEPNQNQQSKVFEELFETYNFSAAQSRLQAKMALFGRGQGESAISLDMGAGVCHVTPMIMFSSVGLGPDVQLNLNLAGRDITYGLKENLRKSGYTFADSSDFKTLGEIKEKFAYVAYDYEQEMKLANETTALNATYHCPKGKRYTFGNKVHLSRERFMCTEPLFRPELVAREELGISEMVHNVIKNCPIDAKKKLWENIVLSGGTSMMAGLANRLEKELKQLYITDILKSNDPKALEKRNIKIKVYDYPDREFMVYNGAAQFVNVVKDDRLYWVSKEEYAECGGSIGARKEKLSKFYTEYA